MRLKDKVAIITGGAGGIGAATARLMAREGAKVVITDIADGTALANEIGGRFVRTEVTDESAWRDLAADVQRDAGRIDILLNAAGVEGDLAEGSPLGSYAEWKRVMAINLDGTYLGIQAVLPGMMERGSGSIINISSFVSYIAQPYCVPYGASKAAVWHLSRSVAAFAALAGTKVRCNSVHPGLIRTRMTDDIFATLGPQFGVDQAGVEQVALQHIPLGHRGEPEDVGHLIVYLASDESSYVTGSEFKVDGGWSLGMRR